MFLDFLNEESQDVDVSKEERRLAEAEAEEMKTFKLVGRNCLHEKKMEVKELIELFTKDKDLPEGGVMCDGGDDEVVMTEGGRGHELHDGQELQGSIHDDQHASQISQYEPDDLQSLKWGNKNNVRAAMTARLGGGLETFLMESPREMQTTEAANQELRK